ncbi:sialidase family protein [Methylobacterium durans]|uniref:sialidase family protein n=1 Tax=Methylobacterium durans TaxID=2202825 RepID=UPI0013A5AB30|nr:sialidase family protein [Methylobacterium durans]
MDVTFREILSGTNMPGRDRRRIPAIYVTRDDAYLVIASEVRLADDGQPDLNKGDDYRIGVSVSLDQGETFSDTAYALDGHLDPREPIGFNDMCIAADGAGTLHMIANSDFGLKKGRNPIWAGGSNRAPIAWATSAKDSSFLKWSNYKLLPIFNEIDTNNVSAGTGFFDTKTDTLVFPIYGFLRNAGFRQWPLYKVGQSEWKIGRQLPAVVQTIAGETEHRIIRSEDGWWYSIGRNNECAGSRTIYRAASIDGSWEAFQGVPKKIETCNNSCFGTTIGRRGEVWLYCASSAADGKSHLRRNGILETSYDRGRTWVDALELASNGYKSGQSFFGYSSVCSSDNFIYIVVEVDWHGSLALYRIDKNSF